MTDLGITAEIAQGRLELYLAAETRVLGNQSYKIGDREMTRADLAEIRNGISYWSSEVNRLNPTPRVRGRARRGMLCNR